MDVALLVARLLLAVVFAVAGLGKLADLAGSRKAMADFGVPVALAGSLGLLLPLAELAIAAALVPARTAWWAALAGLALLVLFMLGIVVMLARGRRPDCHCFGQIHSEPIGSGTLVRNGVLAAVAGFIVWGGRESAGPSVVAWLGEDPGTMQLGFVVFVAVVLVLLAVEAWLLLLLLRQNGRLILRLDEIEGRLASGQAGGAPSGADHHHAAGGLPLGSPAPGFSLPGLHGETLTLDALRARGRQVMLLFMDPNCGPCNALMPDVGRWGREWADRMTVAVVSRGTPEANRAKVAEHGITTVLLQDDYEVADSFDAYGTPSAVLVRPDGTVGSHVAAGPDAIRALAASAAGQGSVPRPAPAANGGRGNGAVRPSVPLSSILGQRAPAVRLPDLEGKTVDLADFRGSRTLVLFWNPGCGFCQRMLPDLTAWEESPPEGAPKLLVVSTGTAEANAAQGIKSPVVLDEGFNVGRAFGASGTPSAVLVDEQGNIASDPAVGGPRVMALARGEDPPAAAPPAPPRTPQVGDPAPALRLPDLEGKTVDLAERRGRPTVLLFWDLGCGFCQQMLPPLREWEARQPPGAPDLIVVSSGSVDDNRAMGLRSTVVLDSSFGVGNALGADGTPIGVLIDADGKLASPLAIGGEAVLEILDGSQPPKPSAT